MIASRIPGSVFGKTTERQIQSTPIAVSGSGHGGNLMNSLKESSMCVSASQAIHSRVQLSLHATRRTIPGASCLLQAGTTWSVKPDVLRPGIAGMRGSMAIRLRSCMTMSTPPLPGHPFLRPCPVANRLTSNAYPQAGVVRGLEVGLQALEPVVPPGPALPLESDVPEV